MQNTVNEDTIENSHIRSNAFWTSDFEWRRKGLFVKKTGAWIPFNLALFDDVFSWLSFYTLASSWRLWRRLTGKRRPTIAFFPDKPRPWYFIWPVMHVAGCKIINDVSKADIVFQFDDATMTDNSVPKRKNDAVLVNHSCNDVSKSRVAEAFAKAAGYSLAVDPETYEGAMVEKSQKNAAHDGRILTGPTKDIGPDKVYQLLIDNEIEGGLVEDLRTCIVGGEPAIVLKKRRRLEARFSNENVEVLLDQPKSVYSADEIEIIRHFAREMGMDWGGVDVLRDRVTGKIFIVDANKTDMGPPVAMAIGQKLRATRWMAHAFAAAFMDKTVQN